MLYSSFVELLPQGTMILSGGEIATSRGTAWAVVSCFVRIALIAGVDRLGPPPVNAHEFAGRMGGTGEDATEFREPDEPAADRALKARLMRTGTVTAIALALHNVPEGFATFVAALQAPEIAIPVVAAIALHNIPEGLAVRSEERRVGSKWTGRVRSGHGTKVESYR